MLDPIYHTYADVQTFKGYLSSTNRLADWTADEALILGILEGASRRIDEAVGNRTFGPYTQTHSFDLGAGALRRDALAGRRPGMEGAPDYWPSRLAGAGIVPLDDWLVAATTVTAYDGTARGSSQVLSEGIAGDYLLEPYNRTPKHTLKLMENTARSLSAGQQTLTIAGAWGYSNATRTVTVLGAAIADATVATITIAGDNVAPGMTILIDAEQLYVLAVQAQTATVERGVNGTTAAAHADAAAVRRVIYPATVVACCLEIARNRWRERDAGIGQAIGTPAMSFTRPGAEERAILRRLDPFLHTRDRGGVYF